MGNQRENDMETGSIPRVEKIVAEPGKILFPAVIGYTPKEGYCLTLYWGL